MNTLRATPLLLILAACSSPSATPGNMTAGDQALLNEAGDMLPANSVALDSVTDNESHIP